MEVATDPIMRSDRLSESLFSCPGTDPEYSGLIRMTRNRLSLRIGASIGSYSRVADINSRCLLLKATHQTSPKERVWLR